MSPGIFSLKNKTYEVKLIQKSGIKPFTSYGKAFKCKKVAMMQLPQKLNFLEKLVLSLIQVFYFLHQRNLAILKSSPVGCPMSIAIYYPAKTIRCPLHVFVRQAPH